MLFNHTDTDRQIKLPLPYCFYYQPDHCKFYLEINRYRAMLMLLYKTISVPTIFNTLLSLHALFIWTIKFCSTSQFSTFCIKWASSFLTLTYFYMLIIAKCLQNLVCCWLFWHSFWYSWNSKLQYFSVNKWKYIQYLQTISHVLSQFALSIKNFLYTVSSWTSLVHGRI